MVDLGGYVIVLTQNKDGQIKLYGSPADRPDCDEVLEINGRNLENASHQHIIQYIHQCIRSKTICLRVKRRTAGKLAPESSLIDAFVIGSRAKEHLQQIAKDVNITPRDIAQLARILGDSSDRSQAVSGSTTGATSKTTVVTASISSASSAPNVRTTRPKSQTSSHHKLRRQGSSTKADPLASDEEEGEVNPLSPKSRLKTTSSLPLSSIPVPQYSLQDREEGHHYYHKHHVCRRSSRPDSSEPGDIEYYELKTQSITPTPSSALPSFFQPLKTSERMEMLEMRDRPSYQPANLSKMSIEPRELPVDVPDSFVGVVKTTPRYPPPPPTHGSLINNASRASGQSQESEKWQRWSGKKPTSIDKLESGPHATSSHMSSHCKTNPAFEPDVEQVHHQHPHHHEQRNEKLLPDLDKVINRLSLQLNGEVRNILHDSRLAKYISIYKTLMQDQSSASHIPNTSKPSSEMVKHVVSLLEEESSLNLDASELLDILSKSEFQGLFLAFDQVLKREREKGTAIVSSSLPTTTTTTTASMTSNSIAVSTSITSSTLTQIDPLTDAQMKEARMMEETFDPSVRVVRIEKSSTEPLGATVRNESDGSVIIGRIVKGGAAEKSGLLHEGDEILEVNGIEMKGRNVNQVCDILSDMTGTLTFVIAQRDSLVMDVPSSSPPHHLSKLQSHPVINLKALFDYDPDDDQYIPCRELGICFIKGDILHVIDQSDSNWWQAYREGEQDQSLAGLIPSVNFQMQREVMKQSILGDANANNNNNNNNRGFHSYKNNRNYKKSPSTASMLLLNCGRKSHQRRKKIKPQPFSSPDEILTYEEVALYYPRPNSKRPIVLIGPTNIGRHELRQRLMLDTERFAAAIPHTSRLRRDGEIDGIDYHFISRTQFEQDIRDGKFVEHGEYEKNYYGTSLSAIEAVIQSGKICVLNLHVHSIAILRQGTTGARIKPYFVFVFPPTQMDKLSRLIASTAVSADGSGPLHHHHHHHHISASDLQSIIDEARDIESLYGHYFDMILTVTDIDRAYTELLREINALERDAQWIPISWIK